MSDDDPPTPHRPPKFVEGVYKPHYVNPDAEFAVFVWPLDYHKEPHLATVDDDGVVRHSDDGTPMTGGGSNIAGVVIDGDIHLSDLYQERLEIAVVEAKLDERNEDSDTGTNP